MGALKATWFHYVKYSTRPYVGTYRRVGDKRVFVLKGTMEDGQPHEVVLPSHFRASKNGWKKSSR